MIIEKPVAFGVNAKDKKIRYESSSGGIFSLCAEERLSIGGVRCGAVLSDDRKSLMHVLIDDIEGLEKMRKSKYLQSQIKDTYSEIEVILDTGRMVLFSGTPCQVAGLKNFLGKKYSNLLTIEVVCHGVPSPELWKRYIEWIEKRYGKRVKDVNFRSKKNSWIRFDIDKILDDGEHIHDYHGDDPYYALFLKNYCLRPSCYLCQTKMEADISLGDLWGIEEIAPELNDDKGTSLVLLNTEKGREMWMKVQEKTVFQEVIYEKVVDKNMCIEMPVLRPMSRDTFFKDMKKMSFGKLAYKYQYPTFRMKIKHMIKSIIKKH